MHGFTVELEEDGRARGFGAGPLLESRPESGIEPLAIAASDGDTGVRRVAVTLGGVAVGTLEPAEGCRDDRLPPCPQALRGTVDVDTRLVPDGARRLRLVVTDAAGNARIVEAGTVQVANQPSVQTPPGPAARRRPGATVTTPPPAARGPGTGGRRRAPASFPPNPLGGSRPRPQRPQRERARLARRLARAAPHPLGRAAAARVSTTVPFGVRVRIRGRLTDERGRPIARAALAAVRREPGRPWRAVTGVRTRPDGRFTAFTRVGPSQELRFVYYAYGDSPREQRSRRLRVRVRPRSSGPLEWAP